MFVAEIPSLPGCISQGITHGEALKNIQEAIEVYIEGLKVNETALRAVADIVERQLLTC